MATALPSRRPAQRTAAVAVVVAALGLTGCSATNPIITSMEYNVVDGVQAGITESLQAQSLLVFTTGEGQVGTMTGALANQGREDVQVTLEPQGADAVTIEVPSRGTVLIGPDRQQTVELDSVAAPPGAHLAVLVSTPEGGSVEVQVPVLDGTLPEYDEIVPEPEG